jgi:hypothetical protein
MRPDWQRDKKVSLLMQGGLRKEPELGDLPSALDFIKNDADRQVLELHFTQKLAARPVAAPPGVAPQRLAMLRDAFAALARDGEFLSEAEKGNIEFNFVPAGELEKVVALVAATAPDIAARYTKAFAAQTP